MLQEMEAMGDLTPEERNTADKMVLDRMTEIAEGSDVIVPSELKSNLQTEAVAVARDTEEYQAFLTKINKMSSADEKVRGNLPRINKIVVDDLYKTANTEFKSNQKTAESDAISAGREIVAQTESSLARLMTIHAAMKEADPTGEDTKKQWAAIQDLEKRRELENDLYDRYIRDVRKLVEDDPNIDAKTIFIESQRLEHHYRMLARRKVSEMEVERRLHLAGITDAESMTRALELAKEGVSADEVVSLVTGRLSRLQAPERLGIKGPTITRDQTNALMAEGWSQFEIEQRYQIEGQPARMATVPEDPLIPSYIQELKRQGQEFEEEWMRTQLGELSSIWPGLTDDQKKSWMKVILMNKDKPNAGKAVLEAWRARRK
jgi:hypothetical protein